MKHRLLFLLPLGLILLLLMPVLTEASTEPKIVINGQTQHYEQSAVIQDGRVLVPFRAIFEKLGMSVDWKPLGVNNFNSSIIASSDSTSIYLETNSKQAKVNGRNIVLDVAPTNVNNRVFVPLRFVAESLGAEVKWDNNSRTVTINHQNQSILEQLNYETKYVEPLFPNGQIPNTETIYMNILDEKSYNTFSNLSEEGIKTVLHDFYKENQPNLLGANGCFIQVYVNNESFLMGTITAPYSKDQITFAFNKQFLQKYN